MAMAGQRYRGRRGGGGSDARCLALLRVVCLAVVLAAHVDAGYYDDAAAAAVHQVTTTATTCAQHTLVEREALRKHTRETGELLPFSPTTANTKHTPYLVLENRDGSGRGVVTVGKGTITGDSTDPVHPTTIPVDADDLQRLHFIEVIYVKDQDARVVAAVELTGTTPRPQLVFSIPNGTTQLTAYALCNKHGLFAGAAVGVSPADIAADAVAGIRCQQRGCGENTVDGGVFDHAPASQSSGDDAGAAGATCVQHRAVELAALREQYVMFTTDAPFAPTAANTKHTPYITVVAAGAAIGHGPPRARVTIGRGTVTHDAADPVHPTSVDTSAGNPAHYVSIIYVKDQTGRVVAAGKLLPAAGERPALDFPVPAGATQLTAYALCNIHGLFRGHPLDVPAMGSVSDVPAAALLPPACGLRTCGGQATIGSYCTLFPFMRAEAYRRHERTVGAAAAAAAAYYTPSAANQKHTPYITVTGTTAVVTVGLGTVSGVDGDPVHPQTAGTSPADVHFIEMLYVEDQRGDVVAMSQLLPGSPPFLAFDVPSGTTAMRAFSLCNKHGLYAGSAVDVVATTAGRPACEVLACGTPPPAACAAAFPALEADALRIQLRDFSISEPFTPTPANTKHMPYIRVSSDDAGGVTARVTVGLGTITGSVVDPVHPVTASADAAAVHFIELIYVKDQTGTIIAAGKLVPTGAQEIVFDVPAGTSGMTAYALCNKHGLYEGDVVAVDTSSVPAAIDGDAPSRCTLTTCGGRAVPRPPCMLFDALRAESQRVHTTVTGGTSAYFTPTPANTKHTPYITFIEGVTGRVRVSVGLGTVPGADASAPVHPSTPSADPLAVHYIERLYVEDQDGVVIAMRDLSGTLPGGPELVFDVPLGTTGMRAFSLCNIHGLFAGDPVDVPATQARGAPRVCALAACAAGDSSSSPVDVHATCHLFDALTANAKNLHTAMFTDPPPFTPTAANAKHTPYLTIRGAFAHVSVGRGTVTDDPTAPVHVSTASRDSKTVHYITLLYVEDQAGRVLAAATFAPTDARPTFEFEVPEGTTGMTAYAMCNKHGLFAGDAMIVTPAQTGALRGRRCRLSRCAGAAAAAAAACPALESVRARALASHTRGGFPNAFLTATAENRKHTPYLAVAGGGAAGVTVGVGTVSNTPGDLVHPTVPSAEGAALHYISSVHVVDQHDAVVAAAVFPPWASNPPTMTFRIPHGTTALRAYSMCNKHGLFEGALVPVQPEDTVSAGAAGVGDASCVVHGCDAGSAPDAVGACPAFDVIKNDAVTSNAREFATSDVDVPVVSGFAVELDGATARARFPDVLRQQVATSRPDAHAQTLYAYVEDASGAVVGAGWYASVDTTPALEFSLPPNATLPLTLAPYVYRTDRGLVRGAVFNVSAMRTHPYCFVDGCATAQPDMAPGNASACFFNTLRADSIRKHQWTTGDAGLFYPPREASRKHQPYITISDGRAVVTVGLGTVSGRAGDPVHPTTASGDPSRVHFIERIYVESDAGEVIAAVELSAGGGAGALTAPRFSFAIPSGTQTLRAYALCNIHGLYQSDAYPITPAHGVKDGVLAACVMGAECAASAAAYDPAAATCVPHRALEANALRIQAVHFNEAAAFAPDATNLKHTPFITFIGGASDRAVVSVGLGSVTGAVGDPTHPTTPSGDSATAHYIELLYVKDERGAVVAMEKGQGVLAAGADAVRMEFAVPAGARTLTAYSLCNKHGLYASSPVVVALPACRVHGCIEGAGGVSRPTPSPAPSQPPTTTSAPAPAPTDPACTPSDVPGYACVIDVPIDGVTLHWVRGGRAEDAGDANATESIVLLLRSAQTRGWLALGFPERAGRMVPSDAVVSYAASTTTGGLRLEGYSRTQITEDSAGVVARQGLLTHDAGVDGGYLTLRVTRTAGEALTTAINIARDTTSDVVAGHSYSNVAALTVDFAGAAGGGTLGAFTTPRDLTHHRRVHAWLMVFAWCWLAPLGILVKRYGKSVFAIGNSTYSAVGFGSAFLVHVMIMTLVIVFTITALGIAKAHFTSNAEPDPDAHNTVGTFVFAIVFVMPVVGSLMPLYAPTVDHRARGILKMVHRSFGCTVGVASIVQVFTGVRKLRGFLDVDTAQRVELCGVIGITAAVALGVLLEVLARRYYVESRERIARIGHSSIDKIRWSDMKRHGTSSSSPWVAVSGRVYAVSAFLTSHPGGAAVLNDSAGTDATDVWNAFRHSRVARLRMEKYFVGEVEDDRMVTAIDLAVDIATAIVSLDLRRARRLLGAAEAEIPTSLYNGYDNLIANVDSYIPFLPAAVVEQSRALDAPVGAHDGTTAARITAATFETNPPTQAALIFTDIQQSTQLWETSCAGMKDALDEHNWIIRALVSECGGYEVKTIGDAFMLAFVDAEMAFTFALRLHDELLGGAWPEDLVLNHPSCRVEVVRDTRVWGGPRVRVGAHFGEVAPQANPITGRVDFFGNTVNIAARIESVGAGGGSIVSEDLMEACGEEFRRATACSEIPLGAIPLKGISRPPPLHLIMSKTLGVRQDALLQTITARRMGLSPKAGSIRMATTRLRAAARRRMSQARRMSDISGNSGTPTSRRPSDVGKRLRQENFQGRYATVVTARLSFTRVLASQNLVEYLEDVIAPVLESLQRTDGVLHALSGADITATWNVARPCPMHATQALRCLVHLYEGALSSAPGPAALASTANARGELSCGLASGWVLSGYVGNDAQRVVVAVGAPVDLAAHCALYASKYALFACCGVIPGPGKTIISEPAVRDHVRPVALRTIDMPPGETLSQSVVALGISQRFDYNGAASEANSSTGAPGLPCIVACYELNMVAMTDVVANNWDLVSEGPVDETWGNDFSKNVLVAVTGGARDVQGDADGGGAANTPAKIIDLLDAAIRNRACPCGAGPATCLCEQCGKGCCSACIGAMACVDGDHEPIASQIGGTAGLVCVRGMLARAVAAAEENTDPVHILRPIALRVDVRSAPLPHWLLHPGAPLSPPPAYANHRGSKGSAQTDSSSATQRRAMWAMPQGSGRLCPQGNIDVDSDSVMSV